jgi:adenylate cyclase
MEDRAAIWRRARQRLRVGLSAANLIGAVTVFVFLTVLVPVPKSFSHDTAALWLNGSLAAAYIVVATVIANRVGPRSAEPIRRWLLSGEPADQHVRDMALRTPLRQATIVAVIWGVATIVFTAVNTFESGAVAAQTAITIPIGGLASCAITYLLAEQFTREITAVALDGVAPEEPIGPGVEARVIAAWGLAAALPLFGFILLAVSILVVGHWSATRIAVSLLVVAAVGLALGFRAIQIAGRSISDPIKLVREALGRVQEGDLNVEIPVYDGSEVGLLQAGFNQMTAGLRDRERIREAFGTYLDREVAEHVLDAGTSLKGEEVEVTAMFVDIRDFTGFAERAGAREVVTAINGLFERIVPIIHDHGGHVDKFVGDGLLAVFGAPRRQPDHADQALAAALEIANSGSDQLAFGVGLNSGPVISGNVGGGGRLEFSVIGDTVNVAARVEAATRLTGDAVLISEHTRARLSSATAGALQERPAIQLKGKSDTVALFAPMTTATVGDRPAT